MNKGGWEIRVGRQVLVALGCCAAAAAWAQDTQPLDAAAEAARNESPVRLEVNTSALPRLQPQDTAFKAPRVDLSLLPAGGGLGMAVGMSGFSATPGMLPGQFGGTRPSVDLGVHYRHTTESSHQIDVTAWRRMNSQPDAYTLAQSRQPVYGARVEMKLASNKGPLLIDRGSLGLQLQSGAKISIKRKDGRPMVYYRNTF